MPRTSCPETLVAPLQRVHAAVREHVRAAMDPTESTRSVATRSPATVAEDGPGDTIYAIDRVGEHGLLDLLDAEFSAVGVGPVTVVGEGLAGSVVVGSLDGEPWRAIVDPIDGTRGLMHRKRSAWVLTGVAPDRGDETSLRDVVVAVQTEIPTAKQQLADRLWAVGDEWGAEREDLATGRVRPVWLRPSAATTIEHGFVSVSRFFPGGRDTLAAVDDAVVDRVLGPAADGKARCFEDQYASTGGQLYELLAGHDLVVADLRPLLGSVLGATGRPAPLCCHPYDVCTWSIAAAAGVVVTGVDGGPLDAPLTVAPDVGWVGYANETIQRLVEPALQAVLHDHGLAPR